MRLLLLCLGLVLASCAPVQKASEVDSGIASAIDRIRAIDNHAHPPLNASDKDYDALPVEAMEAFPLPVRLNSTEFQTPAKAHDPAGILDQAGIGIMLANRIAMGPELPPDRFKWVPFADALMYPLNNESLSRRDPDRKAFFAAEGKLLARYYDAAGVKAPIASFDAFLGFVTQTIERQKQQGAVAEKFEMAYLRTLNVGPAAKADASEIYAAHIGGSTPSDEDYRLLQDFLFRHIAAECGRLKLAVHIHTAGGAGAYYDINGAHPLLLDPLLNDLALRKTNFVVIHGGWPFTREASALLIKPNCYLDFSMMDVMMYPKPLADALRQWLEVMPERILFGTDAGPWGPGVGLEQTSRVAAKTARAALGLALTGMMRDGEISRERALEIARMVLHDNAAKLYGLK